MSNEKKTSDKSLGLEKYEGDFFTFAEVFTATVRNGIVYLEEYSGGVPVPTCEYCFKPIR